MSVLQTVISWYHTNHRPLPWRAEGTTAWGVLVSEVMLQQTPTTRVAPIWTKWLQRWPTPADLAAASTAELLTAWDRLGYPRRALRLHECAQVLASKHGNTVPADLQILRSLPGVGEYTAAAVACFAYGQQVVVLDTNVRRVIGRAFNAMALPSPSLTNPERAQAGKLLAQADDPTWNIAAMELGATICTARSPLCAQCPLKQVCSWRQAGFPPDEFAHRRRTQKWEGTDRQLRGRIMAQLRARPTRYSELEAQFAASITQDEYQRKQDECQREKDEHQRKLDQFVRCVESLVADHLITATDVPGDIEFRLGTSEPAPANPPGKAR